jgi:hypothetical protein
MDDKVTVRTVAVTEAWVHLTARTFRVLLIPEGKDGLLAVVHEQFVKDVGGPESGPRVAETLVPYGTSFERAGTTPEQAVAEAMLEKLVYEASGLLTASDVEERLGIERPDVEHISDDLTHFLMAGGAGDLEALTPEDVADKWVAAQLDGAPEDWDDECGYPEDQQAEEWPEAREAKAQELARASRL